ncbi:MAG TPA: hypothetical protein VHA11_12870 [Bryobacteraceae bacterium]|nr:hypothetical protein [Bryobacteraceae bacterium]
MRFVFILFAVSFLPAPAATMHECACNLAQPETAGIRRCSLCLEAEKHPADAPYFFLRDANPMKRNRWLLLIRSHGSDGPLPLVKLSLRERTALWSAAIERGRSEWGDEWGVAINGDEVRTQCHAHIHIGRLLKGVEYGKPLLVAGPAQIPAPRNGTGMWIHPYGKQLHVHTGEQRAETVLLR